MLSCCPVLSYPVIKIAKCLLSVNSKACFITNHEQKQNKIKKGSEISLSQDRIGHYPLFSSIQILFFFFSFLQCFSRVVLKVIFFNGAFIYLDFTVVDDDDDDDVVVVVVVVAIVLLFLF